jgi:copper(I)-binding protein
MRKLILAVLLGLSIASCARPAAIEIKDAWMRETVGSAANAAVFMTVSSSSDDRLISASTPAAKRTDLMTMRGDGSTMEMIYLKGVDIPAGKPVKLNAGGLHIWLADLTKPLKAGDSVPLVLRFEKAGQRQLTVPVVKAAAAPPMSGMAM